ncbi:MAG: hypothetical protein HDT43_06525 [Ruminococcaceae bacterium]|nr:hypothetical protein [Oscillospiraceae bacterium]
MAQTSATTYKISFKKIARAALAEVRVHKKLAIISYVLFGVAFILAIFNSEVYGLHINNKTIGVFYPSFWGIFFTGAGVIVGYFTALNVFRDMNNQQLCDVSLALPIRSSERFFSKLLALFFMQTAPLILSTLVGFGIKVIYAYAIYGGRMEEDTLESLFTIVFIALAASLFIMAIAVLCACCCGAFAESSYFSIIAMGIINGMPLAYINNIVYRSAGAQYMRLGNVNTVFDLGYWGFLYMLGVDDMIAHCAVNCVISLAIMLLSGLIYVKRDAKTVGTPIASRLFFEIIMFTGCVTVFSVFVMSSAALWGLLIAGVIYIIISIIVSRAKINVLSFLKWIGKYAATAAVFTVLLVVTIKTGGFGLIKIRPDAKFLEGASYEMSFYAHDYENGFGQYYEFISDRLTAEQADEVMKLCTEHIIKGRADMKVIDIIFGNTSNDSTTNLWIEAASHTTIKEKPYPIGFFTQTNLGYVLDYRRSITLSLSEAKALTDELSALGYIRPKTEDDYYPNGTAVSYDTVITT